MYIIRVGSIDGIQIRRIRKINNIMSWTELDFYINRSGERFFIGNVVLRAVIICYCSFHRGLKINIKTGILIDKWKNIDRTF